MGHALRNHLGLRVGVAAKTLFHLDQVVVLGLVAPTLAPLHAPLNVHDALAPLEHFVGIVVSLLLGREEEGAHGVTFFSREEWTSLPSSGSLSGHIVRPRHDWRSRSRASASETRQARMSLYGAPDLAFESTLNHRLYMRR